MKEFPALARISNIINLYVLTSESNTTGHNIIHTKLYMILHNNTLPTLSNSGQSHFAGESSGSQLLETHWIAAVFLWKK